MLTFRFCDMYARIIHRFTLIQNLKHFLWKKGLNNRLFLIITLYLKLVISILYRYYYNFIFGMG